MGRLSGAHIPADDRRPATYILVSRASSPLSLAHELGHFLGAAHHPDPENIMSYGRERRRFSPRQIRVFVARATRMARRRTLNGTLRARVPNLVRQPDSESQVHVTGCEVEGAGEPHIEGREDAEHIPAPTIGLAGARSGRLSNAAPIRLTKSRATPPGRRSTKFATTTTSTRRNRRYSRRSSRACIGSSSSRRAGI